MDSWKITCHHCGQLPFNTVEAPCCGAVYCWECVLNVPQCKGCGLELSPELCKPATAIEKLVQTQRKQQQQQPQHGLGITPDTKVPCPECGTHVAYIRMEEHLALCPRVEMACPNACGLKMKREEIKEHVDEYCPLTVLPCPYGCDTSTNPLIRNTLQAHMDQNVNLHLQQLAKKVSDQDKTIGNLLKTSSSSSTCCPKLVSAWTVWKDEAKRQEWLKAHVPPRTIFTLTLLCLGLLMLSALPFVVQVLFVLIFLRKHPKSSTTTPPTTLAKAKALFRLKAFAALCVLFAFVQFPFWLLIFIVAPLGYLIYLSREDIMTSLQPILNA